MRNFIGIGTGRCGTLSLTKIIGACENTYVTHEQYPVPWYTPGRNLGKLILSMKNSGDVLTGEVSCNLLPHVQQLRDPIRDLKVVCMHRSKEEVTKSFLSWAYPSNLRPSDRSIRARKYSGSTIPDVVERFPVIDAATPEQAWGFYWEYAEKLMSMVKPPVFHMWTKSLNDDFSVKKLFDFLEIPLTDRVLSSTRVWNSSKGAIRA